MGSLIGTLPTTPRQEDQNGLPCILLLEEVRLLVENGIGRTVEYPSFTASQTEHNEFLTNNQEENHMNAFKKKLAKKRADFISKLVIDALLADGDTNCKEVILLNKEVAKIKPYNTLTNVMVHLG